MLRQVVCEIITDVSEKPDASIFMVEEPSALMMKAASFFSEIFITIYYTTQHQILKTVMLTVTAVRSSNLTFITVFIKHAAGP
jgi:hypothetical protein